MRHILNLKPLKHLILRAILTNPTEGQHVITIFHVDIFFFCSIDNTHTSQISTTTSGNEHMVWPFFLCFFMTFVECNSCNLEGLTHLSQFTLKTLYY